MGRADKGRIPVEVSFAAWRRGPGYLEAYDELEEEFGRVAAKLGGPRLAGGEQGEDQGYSGIGRGRI
jgi:hypothetical protein